MRKILLVLVAATGCFAAIGCDKKPHIPEVDPPTRESVEVN
jgi:hypothetical protein